VRQRGDTYRVWVRVRQRRDTYRVLVRVRQRRDTYRVWVRVRQRRDTYRVLVRVRQRGDTYRVLEGKPKEKIIFGRPRSRWEYNIKMDPQEEGKNVDWVDLAQDRDR
jgi:hypothetical protein